MLRSRLAPTPSGFLHTGNGINFVLAWLLVRRSNGILRLRIDDLDAPRIDSEYIEDIFRTLEWLGLDWDEGPQTPDEHQRLFSQQLRIGRYNELIEALKSTGQVFACTCSRKEIQERSSDGQYPGTCLTKKLPLDLTNASLRLITPRPCSIRITDMQAGNTSIDIYDMARHPVIRRRDGIPAYHIASLADDTDHDISLIVRGSDLLSSTAAQLHIAGLLNMKSFKQTTFYHHPLITGDDGQKLSKSAGSTSLKAWRERGAKAEEFYSFFSKALKLPENVISARELLQASWKSLPLFTTGGMSGR
jgi:glutamyl/glutaminyl-tRNA synthetase